MHAYYGPFLLIAMIAISSLHECAALSIPATIKHLFGLQQRVPPTQIGIIKLTAEINDETAEPILKKLAYFAENSAIRGVVFIISSGGGDAGLSELIRREVEYLAQQKPVVALVGGACCSGAYEIAIGTDWIITPAKAVVGSIGVYNTIEKHTNPKISPTGYTAEVTYEIVRSGLHKIDNHPHGPSLDDEGRSLIQSRVTSTHKAFYSTVAEKRNLSLNTTIPDDIPEWADGRAFNGLQALAIGLVDQIGGFSDAIQKLKELIKKRDGTVVHATIFVQ